jgi:hypothetical protein
MLSDGWLVGRHQLAGAERHAVGHGPNAFQRRPKIDRASIEVQAFACWRCQLDQPVDPARPIAFLLSVMVEQPPMRQA